MIRISRLRMDDRGAAAIEMALALPVLVSMIFGLFQVGLLYQANAGMQHALGEGARVATLYERFTANNVPTDAVIKARMNAKLFGKGDGAFTVADPVSGTGYKDLSITYTKKMNFIFFNGPTVTLTRSKRAYTVS
ncbi:MAG: pilus assembly protein [Sphingomonas sp.]|nr:pilus assembly protein [Sphingomonas sp.]